MKNTVSMLILAMGAIGIIGIIESVSNFSLFQTFVSAALIYGAFAFWSDVKNSLKDERE